MSRLKKLAFGVTLYHGTSVDRLRSITKDGMIYPQEQPGGGSLQNNRKNYDGFVFLSTMLEKADYYASQYRFGAIITLDIAEDAIFADDDDYSDNNVDWKKDKDYYPQVKVLGAILTDYIKSVTIFDNGNMILKDIPFSKWEEEFDKKIQEMYPDEKNRKEYDSLKVRDNYVYDFNHKNSNSSVQEQQENNFFNYLSQNGFQVNGFFVINGSFDKFRVLYDDTFGEGTADTERIYVYTDDLGNVNYTLSNYGGSDIGISVFSFFYRKGILDMFKSYSSKIKNLDEQTINNMCNNLINCFGDCEIQGSNYGSSVESLRSTMLAGLDKKTASNKNRLKKLAFGKTLYHGTSLEKFRSIMQSGAIYPQEQPGGGSMSKWNGNVFGGFTFLATTKDRARDYITRYKAGVVIEIDISEDALLPDDDDFGGTTTWQESHNAGKQVKVLGPITTDYFRNVSIYKNGKMFVDSAPIRDWEKELQANMPEGFTETEAITNKMLEGYEYELGAQNNLSDFVEQNDKLMNKKLFKELKDNGIDADSDGNIKNSDANMYINIFNQIFTNQPISMLGGYIDFDSNVIYNHDSTKVDGKRSLFNIVYQPEMLTVSVDSIDYPFAAQANQEKLLNNLNICFGKLTYMTVQGAMYAEDLIEYINEEWQKQSTASRLSKMKKFAGGIALFHCTTMKALKGITQSGQIMPQGTNGAGLNYDDPTPDDLAKFNGYTFFATNLDKAEGYADAIKHSEGEPIIILELKIPSQILLSDDTDCYDCQSWQDSASQVKQVKVEGSVDASMIKKVYFYDSKTMEHIKTTNFDNWQTQYENEE